MVEAGSNLSTNELYQKLAEYLDLKFESQKREIKDLLHAVENKHRELEKRVIQLERKIRKNNIAIFGLKTKKEDDLQIVVTEKLNSLLGTGINLTHINDIYKIGKSNTIILEFISNLQKKKVLKERRRLKGTGIFISQDLCKEDQRENKILYSNLKAARSKNLPAYIKNNKLYVNNDPYTAQQLENISPSQQTEDYEIIIETKSSSAPSTPTIRDNDADIFLEDNRTGNLEKDQQQCSSKKETTSSQQTQLRISTPTNKLRSYSQTEDEIRRLRSRRK